MALEIPSLGRPFSLGMLYDCREEKLIPGITLWNYEDLAKNISTMPQNNTESEVLTSDTVSDKSSALNVSGALKISLWSGMVDVAGSGKYLTDTKESKKQARVTLKYKRTTKYEQLRINHLCHKITYQDAFDKGIATHVVTGILYGAQAFFIFDHKVSTSEKTGDVQGQLKEMVMKILKGLTGTTKMEDAAKEVVRQFSCKFYGDFALEKNPVTYEEVVDIYGSLPKLLGEDGEKAVPMKVWLYPLKQLDQRATHVVREISDHLVFTAENIMQQMSEVVMDCNDMMGHPAAITFPAISNKISRFIKLFERFRLSFQKQLSQVLPSVRSGNMKESALEKMLARKEKSPFREQNIWKFLGRRQMEMEVVHSSLQQLTSFRVVSEQSELMKAISDPNYDHTVCFNFSSVASEDSYLSHLEFWLQKETWNLSDDTKQWFEQHGSPKRTRQFVKMFIELSKEPLTFKNSQFLVTSIVCNASPGITIHYYERGDLVTTRCMPPAKPKIARITERTPHTIELVLQPAEYGRESIKGYKVEYKCMDAQEWSTLTTGSNDLTLTASGLKENSYYLFRYAAMYQAGLSEVSDITRAKTMPQVSTRTKKSKKTKHVKQLN